MQSSNPTGSSRIQTNIVCNACFKPITDNRNLLTPCNHVFCLRCANEQFSTNAHQCPYCHLGLSAPKDIRSISTGPNDVREMSRRLLTFNPQQVYDIAQYSLKFWQYQSHLVASARQSNLEREMATLRHQQQHLISKIKQLEEDLVESRQRNKSLETELALQNSHHHNNSLMHNTMDQPVLPSLFGAGGAGGGGSNGEMTGQLPFLTTPNHTSLWPRTGSGHVGSARQGMLNNTSALLFVLLAFTSFKLTHFFFVLDIHLLFF